DRPRACAVARSRGSRGTWGALGPDMERGRRNHEGRGSLREKLGALIAVGSSVLSRMARRLGCPALATFPVSAVILNRLATVSVEQPLEDVAQLLVAGSRAPVPV